MYGKHKKAIIALKATGALLVGPLAVAACSTPEPEQSLAPQHLTIDLEPIIAEAQAIGASRKQLEALETAQLDGELTASVMENLFLDLVSCLEEAGFIVSQRESEEVYPGITLPALGYQEPPGLTEKQVQDLYLACDQAHFYSAQVYYVSQPVAIDAYLDTFEDQRDSIVQCLAAQGRELDADATPTELLYAVSEVYLDGIHSGLDPQRCWSGSTFYAFVDEGA